MAFQNFKKQVNLCIPENGGYVEHTHLHNV